MSAHIIRLVAVVGAYLLAYYFAAIFGNIYSILLPNVVNGSGFFFYSAFAEQWLAGLPLAALFFIALAQSVLGPRYLWWWIGLASIPTMLFQLAIDPLHIYFPIILGLIAWGLGTMANKMLQKFHPSFMAKFQG
ncbi:MAG: hypothetical protein A2854_04520 [Parcubacteria group bacterium RIFCSPHIGHO2_01_FULL_56_18]|nr:MAG: hypothetical protein A2854_04520 [Parcubacteria group bacterium RIFCSPHIGHO2_01_FULL_56_18]